MNRLDYIAQFDPCWAVTLSQFIEEYPEFRPFVFVAPLHMTDPMPYPNVRTLFQGIVHYICSAGVNYSYAANQWDNLCPLLHQSWPEIQCSMAQLPSHLKIQNKKCAVYRQLCECMTELAIDHNTITLAHLKIIRDRVSGIGDGCVAWCRRYFSTNDNCVEYTDISFRKGFQIIYNTAAIGERRKKADEWVTKGFGRVGNLMVLQVGGYCS